MAEDTGKPEGDDNEGPPEVEAELVGETAPSEEAFDADTPPDAAQAELDPDAEETKPRRKPVLTPGVVLFCAFAVVALGAFGVWRFTAHDAPPAAPETAVTSPAPDLAGEDDAAAAPETAPPAEPAPVEPDESKIANAPADALKPEPAARKGEAGYLPPVTADEAAKIGNSVEDGAKEAMRRFAQQEEQGAAPEPDIDPPTENMAAAAAPGQDAASVDAPKDAPVDDAAGDAPVDDAAGDSAAQVATDAEPAGDADEAGAARAEERLAQLQADFADEKRNLENALDEERRINSDLNAEVERLRAALADAQTARDAAANEEAAALRAEIERVRNEDVKGATRQMRASFALAALSRAIDQGDPYAEELAAVTEFEPAASSALEAHAEMGVATESALRIGFDAAARAALAAARQEKAGGGVAGLIARAQSLVSVRPAEPVTGDAPGAVLSRAEHALEEGDVAFALLQLEDLPVVAQEAMAGWIASARARAEAQAALSLLQAEISGDAG